MLGLGLLTTTLTSALTRTLHFAQLSWYFWFTTSGIHQAILGRRYLPAAPRARHRPTLTPTRRIAGGVSGLRCHLSIHRPHCGLDPSAPTKIRFGWDGFHTISWHQAIMGLSRLSVAASSPPTATLEATSWRSSTKLRVCACASHVFPRWIVLQSRAWPSIERIVFTPLLCTFPRGRANTFANRPSAGPCFDAVLAPLPRTSYLASLLHWVSSLGMEPGLKDLRGGSCGNCQHAVRCPSTLAKPLVRAIFVTRCTICKLEEFQPPPETVCRSRAQTRLDISTDGPSQEFRAWPTGNTPNLRLDRRRDSP